MNKYINADEKFFIAGSRGMAGSAIHRILLSNGYGNENKNGKIFCPSREELDLLNNSDVNQWFSENKPSVLIIAAAKVGGIFANASKPADFILENLKIQTNLIETAWKFGVKRCLFLGSSCIYPRNSEQPIKEEALLSSKLEQTNESYAIAKIAGIKLCEALRKQHNFDAISLMPTNLYGPGDNYDIKNSHVFASFIRRFHEAANKNLPYVTCWGTGEPFREFMHVDDLGRAVLFALENWNPNSESAPVDNNGNPLNFLNVGTGSEIKIKDLASKIAEIVNYKGEIIWDKSKPDGTYRKKLDIEKLKSIGWSPKISLEEGIKGTLKLYQDENSNS